MNVKRLRWRYLIMPGLQIRYMGFIFWTLIVCAIVVGWDVYYTSGRIFISGSSNPEMVNILDKTISLLFIKLWFYMCVVAIISLLVSHRIAGPIYRFGKSFESVASGDLTHRVILRRTDELQETAKSFNAMIETLQQKLKGDRELCLSLAQELKALGREVRTTHPELANQLESLGNKLARFTSEFVV